MSLMGGIDKLNKLEKSSKIERNSWIYLKSYLPRTIYSDPYIITTTLTELCVININTNQIIGTFRNSNGIYHMDCFLMN